MPLKVAWIWPLIDTPQQGACPQTLATNSLSGGFAANGRLSTLLDAGLQWASKDDLTWAIDPALLSDATVMTHAYFTGGNAGCTDRTKLPASAAATGWLSKLAGTAGQPAFLTPYADVDAAALSHAGLNADLASAYQLGDAEASKILPSTFGSSADGTGTGTALAVAWPAGGTADAGTLTSLARAGGINTVVLNSGELATSTPPYDNALARTKTSAGASMSALLADSGITAILGSASAGSSAGAAVRRRPGLPRADRDDRRRGTQRVLPFPGGRAADRLGPVARRGRRAAVADEERTLAAGGRSGHARHRGREAARPATAEPAGDRGRAVRLRRVHRQTAVPRRERGPIRGHPLRSPQVLPDHARRPPSR